MVDCCFLWHCLNECRSIVLFHFIYNTETLIVAFVNRLCRVRVDCYVCCLSVIDCCVFTRLLLAKDNSVAIGYGIHCGGSLSTLRKSDGSTESIRLVPRSSGGANMMKTFKNGLVASACGCCGSAVGAILTKPS